MIRFQRFVAALFLVNLTVAPATADPQSDAEFIAAQTVTRTLFSAVLETQRPLIIPALENQFQSKGIKISNMDGFADIFMEEFIADFTEYMRRDAVNTYLDLFSEDELRALAGFYKSRAGQALIEKTPVLMQRGAKIGQTAGAQAGANAGPRVAQRLVSEGITIDNKTLTQRLIEALR